MAYLASLLFMFVVTFYMSLSVTPVPSRLSDEKSASIEAVNFIKYAEMVTEYARRNPTLKDVWTEKTFYAKQKGEDTGNIIPPSSIDKACIQRNGACRWKNIYDDTYRFVYAEPPLPKGFAGQISKMTFGAVAYGTKNADGTISTGRGEMKDFILPTEIPINSMVYFFRQEPRGGAVTSP